MRYPVDNFKEQWNMTAGYSFGAKTPYGYHEGIDLNMNGGGDIELGSPIYAIAKGKLVYYHSASHPTRNFGYHHVYKIEGAWGVRWVHNAHCLGDLTVGVQDLEEGQQIARVGKSGTVYAHNHFTIFKVDPATLPQGIDTVATTWQQLNDWWEDPIAFIEKWMHHDNEGGEVGMADYYPSTKPQLDLSNRDSMKVAVDVWRKLVTGELVDKKELNKALEELENTRKEVSNLNGTLTEKNEKIEELYLELSSHGSELLRLANENKRLTTQANLVPELNDKIEELEKFRKTTLENQETYNRQLAYYKGRSLDEASISALLTRLIQKIMEAISKGGEKK